MKSPAAYYLLLLYLTLLLRPLIPVIGDELSHEFNEAIHISTVHMLYGANHLQADVARTADTNNNKSGQPVRAEESMPVHIVATMVACCFSNSLTLQAFPLPKDDRLRNIILTVQSPPPKF